MREFKFRAWDGSKMNRVGVLRWSYRDGITVVEAERRPWNSAGVWDSIPSPKLMQFTGLKDKNGIEVYEDDIIYSSHIEDNKAGPVKWSDIHHAYIIDYPRRKGDTTDQWQEMHGKEHCYEVIGNIYENPELLNER